MVLAQAASQLPRFGLWLKQNELGPSYELATLLPRTSALAGLGETTTDPLVFGRHAVAFISGRI